MIYFGTAKDLVEKMAFTAFNVSSAIESVLYEISDGTNRVRILRRHDGNLVFSMGYRYEPDSWHNAEEVVSRGFALERMWRAAVKYYGINSLRGWRVNREPINWV